MGHFRAFATLVTGAAVFLGGCTDNRNPVSTPPPEPVPSIAAGADGRLVGRMQTELELFGRFGDFAKVDATRRISLVESYRPTGGPPEVVLSIERPAPLFPGETPTVDIAEARLDPSAGVMEFRDRSGAVVKVPQRPLAFVPQAAGGMPLRPAPAFLSGARAGSRPPDARLAARMPSPAEWLQAQMDRVRVTPEAAERTLAQLRAEYDEEAGAGGTRVFRHTRGNTEMTLSFDPALGAVTQAEIRENGRVVATTQMKYERVGNAAHLRETVTQTYDAEGKPRARMVRHQQPIPGI